MWVLCDLVGMRDDTQNNSLTVRDQITISVLCAVLFDQSKNMLNCKEIRLLCLTVRDQITISVLFCLT